MAMTDTDILDDLISIGTNPDAFSKAELVAMLKKAADALADKDKTILRAQAEAKRANFRFKCLRSNVLIRRKAAGTA
jgi:hypothetical protein